MERGALAKAWTAWRQLLLTFVVVGFTAGTIPAVSAATGSAGTHKTSAVSKTTKSTSTKKKTVSRKATRNAGKSGARKRVVKRSRTIRRVMVRPSMGQMLGLHQTRDALNLRSSVALVVDQRTQEVLLSKNSEAVLPIASITKLMTALVVVEAHQPLDEMLVISSEDVDTERNSYSRLRVGLEMSREDLMRLALMSSENRAASALGRHYPGGRLAFLTAMNRKARELGMSSTYYADATGLSSSNVSSAADLVRLVNAAYRQPLIREYSTQPEHSVTVGRRLLHFVSSNRLVRAENNGWQIGLQKTGFINEAGHCLLMQAQVHERPVIMVFLDSVGKLTRFADAQRVRQWLESDTAHLATHRPLETAAAPDRAM